MRQFVLSGVDGSQGPGEQWSGGWVFLAAGQVGRRQRQQKQIKSTINGTHKHTESQASEQTVGQNRGEMGDVVARDIGPDTL